MKGFTAIAAAVVNTTSTAGISFTSESIRWRKTQRAVRTSAVVKLISRSLLAGALDPLKHLDLAAGNNLPSVRVVADLLEVIETGRRAPAMHGQNGDLWCLNGEGMRLVLVILSARSAAERSKRPRLDTLREEPEEGSAGGHADDDGGGGSNGGSRCLSGGARLEKEMDVY
ncbi:hypothetical protein Cni_G28218 [Canna indica]|uniref:Uncharacterized protein n=1 Tax=Canna indica TaxID=4628 RepID=A0AAQ3L2Z7_9LILI|nr:hypothetical protein Cni_G28218 [Canna indica]